MLRCDFCKEESKFVQRIALDTEYDRLTLKHLEKYACFVCSQKKEKERLGYDKIEHRSLHGFKTTTP